MFWFLFLYIGEPHHSKYQSFHCNSKRLQGRGANLSWWKPDAACKNRWFLGEFTPQISVFGFIWKGFWFCYFFYPINHDFLGPRNLQNFCRSVRDAACKNRWIFDRFPLKLVFFAWNPKNFGFFIFFFIFFPINENLHIFICFCVSHPSFCL